MLNPFGYFRELLHQDLVIDIGAGDSFADIYGSRRLTRMFVLKYLAHLAFRPLVLAPQTVGPFTRPVSTFLARLSMRLCALVATRDRLSTEAARKMGYSGPIIEASDVALRLPYDPPPVRPSGGPVRVGINVSGLLMGSGYTGQNEFGLTMDYPGLIRDLVCHFQARPGVEVHLVPHVIVPEGRMAAEDDYRASAALAAEFPGVVLAPAFETPSQAKSYISGLDFFMGARMHACIAAFSSGVPVVPMAYSRKFAGLFGSIGYDRTVDCTRETSATILAKIAAAYDDRAILSTEAAAALTIGLERLGSYEAGLKALMGRIHG
jgi:polysaccharide pyruvyl transferase WcaK-like protein